MSDEAIPPHKAIPAPADPVPTPAPPHDLDAERAVLGSVLLRDSAMAACGALGPEDFYNILHQRIFRAMQSLTGRRQPIDPVILYDELGRNGSPGLAGGLADLGDLLARVPNAGNAAHYARIVREAAQRRRAIDAAAVLIDATRAGVEDLGELAARAWALAEILLPEEVSAPTRCARCSKPVHGGACRMAGADGQRKA